MEDLCTDKEFGNLQRRVGNITVKGITSSKELSVLQEEVIEQFLVSIFLGYYFTFICKFMKITFFCEFQDEDELETKESSGIDGFVCNRSPDDTLFEGHYERGVPHGYFRHINSYGDLEFFGCFHMGTMLGGLNEEN